MKKEQLQALRKALFLDVTDAAELVGGVRPRTWQYWEKGDYKIPSDVAEKMQKLAEYKREAVKICLDDDEEFNFSYYLFEEFAKRFGADKRKWRLYQAVLGEICIILGNDEHRLQAPEDCAIYKYFEELKI